MGRRKTCKTCLWWWDLYDTDEWICYNCDSPFFHKVCKAGCAQHENTVHLRMGIKRPKRKKGKTEVDNR